MAHVRQSGPFLTKILGPAGKDIRILGFRTLPDGIEGRIPNRLEPLVMGSCETRQKWNSMLCTFDNYTKKKLRYMKSSIDRRA